MSIHRKPWAAAVLPLCFVTHLSAEEALDPIVITATRQETRVSEVLADVTVIGREEIERNSGGAIMDLLSRQPGIQVSSDGGPGTLSRIYLRGARADQTKILVDGLPINSIDLAGSPLRYIPLDNVERIEVLRGPASTLYGADAIGGVIQIFTRQGAPGLRADGFIGYGSHDTWEGSAGVSGGNEQWRFRFDANQTSTDGVSAQKSTSRRDADKDAYRNSGGSVALSFLPAQGQQLGVLVRQNSGRTHYDSGNVPADGDFDNYVDFRTEQWQVFSRNRMNDIWTSKLQYGETSDWQKNYAVWAPQGSLLNTTNKLASWQNDIVLPLGKALLGVEHLTQEASPQANFSGDDRMSNTAVFAGWNASAGSHRWQVSGRNDEHSQFGNKGTYTVAYGYQLTEQWRLQGSYGTAFKAPSLYQLYDPWSGNAQLKPEEAKNVEASVVWESRRQSASATYYHNRVKNMIDWSSSDFKFHNLSKARLEGVTLNYRLLWQETSLYATYDWLNATDDTTGFELGRRARNKALLGASRTWRGFEGGLELVASDRRYDSNRETGRMGGYGLVNLTARYPINKNLALEGRVNNLFDKQYELSRGYNTLGLNAFFGLRYTLD